MPGLTAAAGEGVLSPMLSELMSLGADVIDLAGSEADSDLLAVTPDRTCSRPGAAAQAFERAAAEYEGLNRQLVFEEEEGAAHLGAAQQGAVHTASTPQQDLQPAAADDSEQQHQQHSAIGRAGSISLTGMKLEAAIAAASGPGQGSPGSAAAAIDDGDDAEAPVLRLRGGAGYEPADGDDGADWLLDVDESFDLADYGSSDDVSDGPSEDPWELIPPGGTAAAPETSDSSVQHSRTSAPAGTDAAAAGNTRGKLASTSPGQKAARRAALPPGWLRPLPVGWGIGSAPDNAFRVALRTSAKPGSGTKTRVR